jgi:cytochrome c553
MVILASVSGACQPSGGREAAREDLAEHMSGHFEEATVIRQAVVDGDLDLAQRTAREFARHREPEGLRDGAQTYLPPMRQAADDVARSRDLVTAGAAVGRLAAACGACHQAVDARPGFPIDAAELEASDAPLPPSNAAGHMRRHQWAADRLWEGLIAPSDRIWAWGASALQDAALRSDELTEEPSDHVNVTRLAIRVHEIGLEASKTSDLGQRAELYGELVGTCATCHREIRR